MSAPRSRAGRPVPLRFGTSGWRGVLGDEVTDERVRAAAHGIAGYFRRGGRAARLIVGFDGRFASERLAGLVVDVLAERGVAVVACEEAAPTPALVRAIGARGAAGAVVVTASHNSAHYHGLKVFGAAGESIADAVARQIERGAARALALLPRSPRAAARRGRVESAPLVGAYRSALRAAIDVGSVRRARPRVVYDAMHGMGAGVLDVALGRAGARTELLRGERDPTFGGDLPDPAPERLRALARALRGGRGLRLGLATDGDGDRIGAVDERGRVLADGELAALLLDHLARSGRVVHGVAMGLACSSRLDAIAQAHGLATSRHPVGFKHLAPELLAGRADLAIDESGGIAFAPFSVDKDGMFAGALLVELVAQRRSGLAGALREIEAQYGRRCARRTAIDAAGLAPGLARLGAAPPGRIDGTAVLAVDHIDGLRVALADGFVMWRASGTEPLIRVYAEGRGKAAAERRLAAGIRALRRAAR